MNGINYNPTCMIQQHPDRFGGNQQDYIQRSRHIIGQTAQAISDAKTKGEDFIHLFYQIIENLSRQRAEIASIHKTYNAEFFGKRRDKIDRDCLFTLKLEDVYQHCNDALIPLLTTLLKAMELKNGDFKKRDVFEENSLGVKSILNIEILRENDLKKNHTKKPIERRNFCSAKKLIEYFPSARNLKCSMEDIVFSYPPKEALLILKNSKSALIHAALTLSIDDEPYELTDYWTWMYEKKKWLENKDPKHHPIELMKKNSRVMLAHQEPSKISKTLELIAAIFKKAITWNKETQTIEELQDLMALFCFLSAHNMRDERGSAAETEWLRDAIYLSLGVRFSIDQNHSLIDLEAFSNPMFSEFKKIFDQMIIIPETAVEDNELTQSFDS